MNAGNGFQKFKIKDWGEVYLIPISDLEGTSIADLLPKPFFRTIVCFGEGDISSEKELKAFLKFLLDSGARYFMCCGDLSEVMHDQVDDLREIHAYESEPEDCIPTTSHNGESLLEDILEFAMYSAYSCDRFEKDGTRVVWIAHENSPVLSKAKTIIQNYVE
ncbi:DUF7684 family protein [Nitrospina watsonii]|uniref:DUF7684 domain-containing protein n=1 Tax=Nitrospina watsonii TaxID=1323948 RepID=A0ABM9HA74_9BACT|nr:hypothetical protein [Nitrospina watsonii]CAI2717029.1 protein of unknown function [Nitrospina watsonii]